MMRLFSWLAGGQNARARLRSDTVPSSCDVCVRVLEVLSVRQTHFLKNLSCDPDPCARDRPQLEAKQNIKNDTRDLKFT